VARPATTALAILVVALGACGGDDSVSQAAQRVCDRFASPGRGAVQRLVRSLQPGEVGCLRGGTYRHALTIDRSGTAARPITLQARPGERARLVGPVAVTRSAKHVVIRGLYLDGRNAGAPSPIVNGSDILFVRNDVTNAHTSICFALGNPRFGVARNVTIQRNRIHECGRLPATNLEQGVYVAVARGTKIVGNWIYENADQGVQLYPDARGTYVAGNVIDGNGEGIIFGGLPRVAARDNLVKGNVISNSRIRNNVEWHFEGTIGTNNILRGNCIGGGAGDDGDGDGGIMQPAIGFTPVGNVLEAPVFRSEGDYRLKAGSRCTRVFAGDPNRVPGPLR
jgi:hypothetical protein